MNALRLYETLVRQYDYRVTLVHANRLQVNVETFERIVFLGPDHPTSSPGRLLRFLWNGYRWLSVNGQYYHVFHGLNFFEDTVRPALWAHQKGLRTVVKPASSLRGLPKSRLLSRMLRMRTRRKAILRKLDGVVAISSTIEQELLEFGVAPERILSIPNGVSVEQFFPDPVSRLDARDEFDLNDRFWFLFVGAICDRKRPHWLLRAYLQSEILRKKGGLLFVGPLRDDTSAQEVTDAANAPDLMENIRMVGSTNDPVQYYRAADAFVLPSQNEGMPNAALEAMSAGLPVIMTPVSGSDAIVDEGVNGFIVNEIDQLSRVMEYYVKNPQVASQHGAESRRIAVERFSLDRVAEAYHQAFTRLINTGANKVTTVAGL